MTKHINIHEDNINIYLKEANKLNQLKKGNEYELIRLTQSGNKKALHELINSNLNFVVSIAKEYQGNGVSIGDLINDGNEGVIKAAFRFDVTKGVKFISYAVWWVRQSIIQGINENGRTIRLPVNVINDLAKVKQLIQIFEEKEGREPYIGDYIGDDKNGNPITYNGITQSQTESLNNKINSSKTEFIELVVDESTKTDNFETDLVKKELNKLLSKLNQREQLIITLSFGLDQNRNPMTLGEIGEQLDITKERVRQIKEKSLRKLRFESINLLTIINN